MRHFIFTVLTLLLSVPSVLLAAEGGYPRPDLLLEPAELAKPEVGRKFVILDARKREEYERERIPGARWVDHDEWKDAVDSEDASQWSKRIGELGISTDADVVVYDDSALKDAARIWWILRYWGLEDVRLLNGGWTTWKAEGFPTTAEEPKPAESVPFEAEPHSQRLTTKCEILDLLSGNRLQIVDARSEAEFCGTEPLRNERAGAIPGAKHLDWSALVDQESHRFKTPEELRRLFEQAGIDLNRPIASHCQSGGRASVMVFGLELMGADDVANYYPGWSEWGNADDTPIVPGEKAGR